MKNRYLLPAALTAAAALLLGGCTSGSDQAVRQPSGNASPTVTAQPDEPVEDRVYPDVGDPGVRPVLAQGEPLR
jgi:hypothetical protein